MSHELPVSTFGLVLHPTKPVADSIATILAWSAGHAEAALAREQDRLRVPPEVELVGDAHACLVADAGDIELATAHGFNDVVLARLGRTGAVSIDLEVNGLGYGYYKGDAVVISTADGSTAYNYAAGGPILSPSAAAVVITPVAPMAGIGRSGCWARATRSGSPRPRTARRSRSMWTERPRTSSSRVMRLPRGCVRTRPRWYGCGGHARQPEPGEAVAARPSVAAGAVAGPGTGGAAAEGPGVVRRPPGPHLAEQF